MHVLFVCTGNICRSPTAERLATAYAKRMPFPDFSATSAGTRASVAQPIHPDAALVLERLGGQASGFAARQLTAKIAYGADLIVTMTRAHREYVLELAPRHLKRTFTLAEASHLASELRAMTVDDLGSLRPLLASDEAKDVADPIGRDLEVFSAVGTQIAELISPILEFCLRATDYSSE